jgi:hypothetical protein
VIIHDLDVIGVTSLPTEADSPLHIDRNAPLTRSIAFELLEAIARRDKKIVDLDRGVEHLQLPECCGLDIRRQVF